MQVTTRQTYTLTGIEGTLASEGGKLTFREQDGIDYAASTVLAASTDCSVDLEQHWVHKRRGFYEAPHSSFCISTNAFK